MPSKILVVDDSELLHRMYDLVLMRYRHDGTAIVHARNGAEAMGLVHQHRDVDLVLLDINMPVMNGLQVLERLRATGRLSHLKVFMISTVGHDQDVRHALEAGAHAYLTKPFTAASLHELITLHCGASPTRRASADR